ncbi:MAG: stage II sporulation protein M [Planctomycetes bacterium]|nr:stage II sporulation protein M [Planctomycetota bacterium]
MVLQHELAFLQPLQLDLVARGHNAFYTAPPGNLQSFLHYLSVGFPRLFRANIAYFLTASILFFVPGAISWAVIQSNPSLATRVIPSQYLEQFDSMYGDRDKSMEDDEDAQSGAEPSGESDAEPALDTGFGEERALMAGFYVKNNVGIALVCFVRGILLGIGTVYTLLYNGIFIGAIGGYIVSQGHSERFLSFVVSHGSFELTAIAISGGAGLMLGNSLLHPGQRTRLESLRVRGLEAVQIAAGAAVMLMIAAVIEAFWSPSGVPSIWKYLVGTGLWLLVILYLALAGRGQ